jgi:hypothetical protein
MAATEVLNIEIMGQLDPSVMATVNAVKAQLKSIGADQRTSNEVMRRTYKQMFDGIQSDAKKAESGFKGFYNRITEGAKETAHRIKESIGETMKEIGHEMLKGVGFGAGFGAAEMVGAGLEKSKEFGAESLKVRAERESYQATLHSILSSTGRPEQAEQIDQMLRNFEGRRGPETYNTLIQAVGQMLQASPTMFKTVPQIKETLGMLADLSRDTPSFERVTSAFTKMIADSKIDMTHLKEMSIDSGFAIREAVSNILKMTPDEITKAMKKGELKGPETIKALIEGMTSLTAPGGAAFEHGIAQMSGLKGIGTQVESHVQDFQESFGRAMEQAIQPIAQEIFSFMTPAALVHAFDPLQASFKAVGETVAQLISVLHSPENIGAIQGLTAAFQGMFSSLVGMAGHPMMETIRTGVPGEETQQLTPEWKAKIQAFSDGIRSVIESLTNLVNWTKNNMGALKDMGLIMGTIFAGSKVYGAAKGIAGLLKEVGVMDVHASVVNVSGGAGGTPKMLEDTAKKAAPGIVSAVLPAIASTTALTLGGAAAAAGGMLGGGWLGAQIADRYHIVPFDPERDRWSKMRQDQSEMMKPAPMAPMGLGTPGGAPATGPGSGNELRALFQQSADAMKDAPAKAQAVTGSMQQTASTAQSWPGIGASITGALNSLASAIKGAAAAASSAAASAGQISVASTVHVHGEAGLASAIDDHADKIAAAVSRSQANANAANAVV